jgi:hypothetical protein
MSNSAKTFPRAIYMTIIGLHRCLGVLWKKSPDYGVCLSGGITQSVSCLIRICLVSHLEAGSPPQSVSIQIPGLGRLRSAFLGSICPEGNGPKVKAEPEDNQADPRQLGLLLPALIDVFHSPPTMNKDVTNILLTPVVSVGPTFAVSRLFGGCFVTPFQARSWP